MLNEIKSKSFANGKVYVLHTEDGLPIETTDTFLPFYTKSCINENSNKLKSAEVGNRTERWMIGVSVASGCCVGCQFCATGNMKRYRPLTAEEIVEQVKFILAKNAEFNPEESKEFKINFTRMGDLALNLDNVKKAIKMIDAMLPNTRVHHFVSTIGVKGTDFSWIKDNITLQLSLHSLDEERRNELIPFNKKMTIEELGKVRTNSALKTTLNMTLVDFDDFDIKVLEKYFDKEHFFIKLSPINENEVSKENHKGKGIITAENLI